MAQSTRVPLRQGDVILRKSTLWHRGMPNNSRRPRPMMAITFGEMDDPDPDPFALNDGKTCSSPTGSGPAASDGCGSDLRQGARSYSTYRFARSLYGNKGYASF